MAKLTKLLYIGKIECDEIIRFPITKKNNQQLTHIVLQLYEKYPPSIYCYILYAKTLFLFPNIHPNFIFRMKIIKQYKFSIEMTTY